MGFTLRVCQNTHLPTSSYKFAGHSSHSIVIVAHKFSFTKCLGGDASAGSPLIDETRLWAWTPSYEFGRKKSTGSTFFGEDFHNMFPSCGTLRFS